MNIAEPELTTLLEHLRQHSVELYQRDGKLKYRASSGVITDAVLTQLVRFKPQILAQLRDNPPPRTLVPDLHNRYQPFVLTDVQHAYWIGRNNLFSLGNVASHVYFELDIDKVSPEVLNRCWRQLVKHHDMLRTVFLDSGEQQILASVPDYEFSFYDLTTLNTQAQRKILTERRQALSHQVLAADTWPLFDIRVSQLAPNRYRYHLGFDFMICDATSMFMLLEQWWALCQNPDYSLDVLQLSFRDYVIATELSEQDDAYIRAKEYWLNRLPTLPGPPSLPILSPSDTDTRFARLAGKLDKTQWRGLRDFAAQAGLTVNSLLLAAFSAVLARWSQSPDFTINLTLFNRQPIHPQVNQLVGDFTSLTLLAVTTGQPLNLLELVAAIQRQLWQDLDHRQFSGVQVLRSLSRQQGSAQLMPVVFTSMLGVVTTGQEAKSSMDDHLVYALSQTPQVWLDHQVGERHGELLFNWDYVPALFPDGMLEAMFSAYNSLLGTLLARPENWRKNLAELISISTPQRSVQPYVYPMQKHATLHSLFAQQVHKRPEHVAIKACDRQLSYTELACAANAVQAQLTAFDLGNNPLVAVVMEKGWEQAAAVLGILQAGGAYVPIDPALPLKRRLQILQSCQIRCLYTQQALQKELGWPEGVEVLLVPQTPASTAIPVVNNPDALAYVIFTSGSTGQPKGVMVKHRAVVNTIVDINQRFGVDENDVVLALSNLNFDLSVYDLFGTWAAGGTVVMPDEQALRSPDRWWALINQHGISIWNSVPALMSMLTEYRKGQAASGSLRLVLLSGDWIPLDLPENIRTTLNPADIISLGGATEAAIWSIFYPVEQISPDWRSIPYGKPLSNQGWYVYNQDLAVCPVWVAGDLYISGAGLAEGYWHDREKTATSFIYHPLSGERLYRTGDVGRYLPDGNIEFLGRSDNQVKIRGHRIELGEIEAALCRHAQVKQAVALVKGSTPQELALHVAIVLHDGVVQLHEDDASRQWQRYLSELLPEYMLPSSYLHLSSLPLTANGKVDREKITSQLAKVTATTSYQPPQTRTEARLLTLWQQVLPASGFGIHDDFFTLGGDSLQAIQVFNLIRQDFGQELAIHSLFEATTIHKLALLLDQDVSQQIPTNLVRLQSHGERLPLFCVHASDGFVYNYRALSEKLGKDQPFYAFQARGIDGVLPPHRQILSMANEYLLELRKVQPSGSYQLAGWSLGALIALEMARQLDSEGDKVQLLCLIDPPVPHHWQDTYMQAQGSLLDKMSLLVKDPQKALAFIGLQREAFIALDEQEQLAQFYDGACFSSQLPAEIDFMQFCHVVQVINANLQAISEYQPCNYPSDAVVYLSPQIHADKLSNFSDFWQAFLPEAVEHQVPGDHWSMFTNADNLKQLADVLSLYLSKEAVTWAN